MKLKRNCVNLTLLFCFIAFYGCFDHKEKTTTINLKSNSQVKNGIWIDLILGGPPMPNEFKAIDSLTKKYKINYQRIEMGCEFSENDILLKEKYKISNQKYFKELEVKLGKNWKAQFDAELNKMNKTLMNQNLKL